MSHGFHDYTQSSALERFIDGVERSLKELLSEETSASSTARSVSLTHALPFRKDPYILTWLPGGSSIAGATSSPLSGSLPDSGSVSSAHGRAPWMATALVSHDVKYHDWFLPHACIIMEPDSYSRRILTNEEYHTLLSAVAVALDALAGSSIAETGALPPVYLPRQDARRDASGGVRKVMLAGDDTEKNGKQTASTSTQWFDCDSVHGRVREVSAWVGDVGRRLELFAGRLHGTDRDRLCRVAEAVREGEEVSICDEGVICCSKRTFHVYCKVNGTSRDGRQPEGREQPRWDAQMAWAPWVMQDDPVGGVEVDMVEADGVAVAHEIDPLSETPFSDTVSVPNTRRSLRIYAMDAEHAPDTGTRSFLPLQVVDVSRKFLRCVDVESLDEQAVRGFPVRPCVQSGGAGFAARLHVCLRWYRLLREHERDAVDLSIEDVIDESWWVARADELGVDIEPPIAPDDVTQIVESVLGSSDAWDARGVPVIDVLSLHATTIPDSLRGVMQVWSAFANLESLPTMGASEAMGRMIIGLFRAACATLRQCKSDIVRRQVAALRAASESVLRKFLELQVTGSVDCGTANEADMAPMYGISNVLGCIEHASAAVASLRQRLDGLEAQTINRLVDGMLSNAMRSCPNAGFLLTEEDVNALVCADRSGAVGLDGPVSIEHVVEVHDRNDSSRACVTPRHRMYISRLPNEVRIATTIHE